MFVLYPKVIAPSLLFSFYRLAEKDSETVPIGVIPGSKKKDSAPVTLSDRLADEGLVPSGSKEKSADELTFINEGFPPIATKIVRKIEKGEYVDFVDLLPKKPGTEEPSYAELAKEGIIVVTESRHIKGQRKGIPDIGSWMEAFLLYATVRNRKHPEHTNDLLAYGALIVKGAREYKGLGWLAYDFQFRRLAAARGNLGNWGVKDVSLWSDTVCRQSAGEQPRSPSMSSDTNDKGKRKAVSPAIGPTKKLKAGREKQWKGAVCYPFSYSGKCTRENCEFLHVCYDCGGPHTQTSCPKKDK